jgi:hypothetical protein
MVDVHIDTIYNKTLRFKGFNFIFHVFGLHKKRNM